MLTAPFSVCFQTEASWSIVELQEHPKVFRKTVTKHPSALQRLSWSHHCYHLQIYLWKKLQKLKFGWSCLQIVYKPWSYPPSSCLVILKMILKHLTEMSLLAFILIFPNIWDVLRTHRFYFYVTSLLNKLKAVVLKVPFSSYIYNVLYF